MRERVYENIATISGQANQASLTANTQRYEQVIVSIGAEGAAGTALLIAPAPSRAPYNRGGTGAALVAPLAGEEHHYGIGPGMDIGCPVPDSLVVSLTAAGGLVSIRVAGVYYREVPDTRGSSLAAMRDQVDRILSKITVLVDLLSKGRR